MRIISICLIILFFCGCSQETLQYLYEKQLSNPTQKLSPEAVETEKSLYDNYFDELQEKPLNELTDREYEFLIAMYQYRNQKLMARAAVEYAEAMKQSAKAYMNVVYFSMTITSIAIILFVVENW